MFKKGLAKSLLLLFAACRATGLESATYAQTGDRDEYEVKTAYLFQFGSYIEWINPVVKDKDLFVIGILGADPSDAFLRAIADKTIQGKKVVVRRFAKADDYQPCHFLFVAAQAVKPEKTTLEERLKAVVAKAGGAMPVIITEGEGMARKGAVINFYLRDNRIHFEINPSAARRAGVQISSKLLKVGKLVDDE